MLYIPKTSSCLRVLVLYVLQPQQCDCLSIRSGLKSWPCFYLIMPMWYLSMHFLVLPWFSVAVMVTEMTSSVSLTSCKWGLSTVLSLWDVNIPFRDLEWTLQTLSGFQSWGEQLPLQFCCSIRTSICGSVPVCWTMPFSDLRAQVTREVFTVFSGFVHIWVFEMPKCSWHLCWLCCLFLIIHDLVNVFFASVEVWKKCHIVLLFFYLIVFY